MQSYLASVCFVDDQVGKVMRALEKSAYRDNTIVILFSDHGFHLGEKERWAKRSLWQDSTRVPLIFKGPGISVGKVSTKPVQLLDIYPTLLELTGHKSDSMHEGHSLLPLLRNPNASWPYLARTSFGPGNVSLFSEKYHYIRYYDGSEEFYDFHKDPHEWKNLVHKIELKPEIERYRAKLPKKYAPILGKGSTGHHSFKASMEALSAKK